MRAVIDTNLIISAIFWKGIPEAVYQAAREEYQLLTSTALIAELDEVVHRTKFVDRLTAIRTTPERIVADYIRLTREVTPADIPADVIRDPKDRIVLACAVGGQADYIVSGDKDLLTLERYKNIPIINATQFLERLDIDSP